MHWSEFSPCFGKNESCSDTIVEQTQLDHHPCPHSTTPLNMYWQVHADETVAALQETISTTNGQKVGAKDGKYQLGL